VSVCVVAAIRLYREGLAEMLEMNGELEVCVAARSVSEALERLESPPDAVLLDAANAPRQLRLLARNLADVPLVILAAPDEEDELLALAEAGACGYVTRDGSIDDVIQAVERAVRGEALCSPRMAARLMKRVGMLAREQPRDLPSSPLTRRECEILGLIDRGLSNKEIAGTLCIEIATVKNHVHHILEKLHVHRRGEAAARARALAEI